VIERRPDARGVVIGSGRLDAEVAAAAAAVSGGRVEVLGSVDDDRVAREYARAAVVLMPSMYEGLGLVALEALVAGAAVAGYDVTGLHDAVGEGGLLVGSGDRDSLVASTVELLSDERRRAELAATGRDRTVRLHSWDAAAADIHEVYQHVLAQV
jgi:glycosyltransferase involved in cell wall biosynthesis